jgi:hypothetical protein
VVGEIESADDTSSIEIPDGRKVDCFSVEGMAGAETYSMDDTSCDELDKESHAVSFHPKPRRYKRAVRVRSQFESLFS